MTVNGPIGEEWRDSHAISDDLAREETSSDGVRWIWSSTSEEVFGRITLVRVYLMHPLLVL